MSPNTMTARDAARYYRDHFGWNPLPSLAGEKRPTICYSELWDRPVWDAVMDHANWPNLQLMTGVRWGLAVVDLDGELAAEAWQSLALHRELPRTWTVRTASGNWHLWFTIPTKVQSLPYRVIWESSEKHSKVELIGDRRLIVAPPSKYAEGRYLFIVGPRQMPTPAMLPQWVMDLPPIVPPRPEYTPVAMPFPPAEAVTDSSSSKVVHHDWRRVLDAIPDKLGLARSWGLRVLDRATGSRGWLLCHAVDREDENPSAGFHPRSGFYCEPDVRRLGLFEVAVALGRYATWQEACNRLGSQYAVR